MTLDFLNEKVTHFHEITEFCFFLPKTDSTDREGKTGQYLRNEMSYLSYLAPVGLCARRAAFEVAQQANSKTVKRKLRKEQKFIFYLFFFNCN